MQCARLPDFVVSDNDGVFGYWLESDLKDIFNIQLKKNPPKKPWLNPYVERFQRSLKEETLQRIELGEIAGYRNLCLQFQNYYNLKRPHQGILGKTPVKNSNSTTKVRQKEKIKFKSHLEMNGLVKRFSLVA